MANLILFSSSNCVSHQPLNANSPPTCLFFPSHFQFNLLPLEPKIWPTSPGDYFWITLIRVCVCIQIDKRWFIAIHSQVYTGIKLINGKDPGRGHQEACQAIRISLPDAIQCQWTWLAWLYVQGWSIEATECPPDISAWNNSRNYFSLNSLTRLIIEMEFRSIQFHILSI